MSIKNIKRIITAWKPSTFETYKKTFEKYGGSVNMHPDVVSYFMIHHDWKFDFFHYEKDGDIKGSYFLCNGKQIGIMARRSYPLSVSSPPPPPPPPRAAPLLVVVVFFNLLREGGG
ncbi:hypothetical protein ACKWMO_24765, partial [Escherichia coli]